MLYKLAGKKKKKKLMSHSKALGYAITGGLGVDERFFFPARAIGAYHGYDKNHTLAGGLGGAASVNGAYAKDTGKSYLKDTVLGGAIGGAIGGTTGRYGAVGGALGGALGSAALYGLGHEFGSNQRKLYVPKEVE